MECRVIELQAGREGEQNCKFEWEPGLAADPRKVYQKEAIPEGEKNPEPKFTGS